MVMPADSATEFKDFRDSVVRALDKFEGKLDHLADDVKEIREAQIRLEAANHGDTHTALRDDIDKLTVRIVQLESKAAQQTGFIFAMDWIYKLGPWILIAAVSIFMIFTGRL